MLVCRRTPISYIDIQNNEWILLSVIRGKDEKMKKLNNKKKPVLFARCAIVIRVHNIVWLKKQQQQTHNGWTHSNEFVFPHYKCPNAQML